jgi:4-hydroxy-2-oxoglutarate aldolase
MSMMDLGGVFAPVPTPFDEVGRLDLGRFRAALTRWLARPLAGFVVLGTTGEAPLVDEDESARLVQAARDQIPKDRLFIVGCGRESTAATIEAAIRAGKQGADAVLVRTPSFFKSQMTDEAFVRHYTSVAAASPVPILLYNFSAVTGVDLAPSAVSRIAPCPNVVGMKESGGDVDRMKELVSVTPPGFSVLTGSGSSFHQTLLAGATGGILALSCVVPDACARIYEMTRQGRHDAARTIQEAVLPLARLIGAVHGVPGLKAALGLVGCDVGVPRAPLATLAPGHLTSLREALALCHEAAV